MNASRTWSYALSRMSRDSRVRLYSVGVAGVVAADGAAPRWWVWVGIVHLCAMWFSVKKQEC